MDAAQSAHCRSMAAQRVADTSTVWTQLREGKRECMWSEMLELKEVGSAANPARRIYRLSERTLDKEGQVMLMPHYTLDGWTTTLPVAAFDESAVESPCTAITPRMSSFIRSSRPIWICSACPRANQACRALGVGNRRSRQRLCSV